MRNMKKFNTTEPDCDLLYITFIDMESNFHTGSSVRPLNMLKAFQELGLTMKVLSGEKTKKKKRRKKIEEIIHWLDTNTPKFCYIEPPSGPFYDWKDLYLIKKLHIKKIPIGLFYRDAYWMFPEYGADGKKVSFQKKIKLFIIKGMQQRDLRVFKRTCDHIFFPSDSMADYFHFKSQSALPPGCVIRKDIHYDSEEFVQKETLTFIFVGGAARNHGTFLTLEAFEKVNQNKVVARLIYICPRKQWDDIKNEAYKKEYLRWLSIYHVSGDEELASFYKKADVALLAAPNTEYRNFAVPVKIFEYISYGKPVLVTNCYETEKAVLENQVGWSVPDNASSVCRKIFFLYENQKEIYEKRSFCKKACMHNSWVNRAKEVLDVLSSKSAHL